MLLKASQLGRFQQVRACLEKGASINCQDENDQGFSPLHYSIKAGWSEIVHYLLTRGANAAQVNKEGYNALQLALFQTYLHDTKARHNVISLLQSHGASFENSIFEKAYKGQLASLLEDLTSTNINQTDSQGYSVLHYACASGSLRTIKALVEQRAELSLSSQCDAMTPLLVAAHWGHTDIAQWLLSQGASLKEKNKEGITVFLCAVEKGCLETIEWLLEQGVSIAEKSNNEATALLLAATEGHLEVVQYLLKHGASITEKDDDGCTALLLAANEGHIKVVKCLLEQNASTAEKDSEGNTALSLAANGGHLKVIKYLVHRVALSMKKTVTDGQLCFGLSMGAILTQCNGCWRKVFPLLREIITVIPLYYWLPVRVILM